jgi:multicomponent Na+:H+ antiporter subunit G
MAGEWIRFGICAVLILGGLFAFLCATIGVWRFGYVLNRVHAAGMGDTAGLMLILAGLAVASGLNLNTVKLVVVALLTWITSPAGTHLLSQIEYYTNPALSSFCRFPGDPNWGCKEAQEEHTDEKEEHHGDR